MQKPDESLDDFIVQPEPEVEPPRKVSLRLTGEIEVLKPLKLTTQFVRTAAGYQPLWFRRLIAVGSGALVMMAFVRVSAILIGINEPLPGADVAANLETADEPIQTGQTLGFEIFSSPEDFTTQQADVVRETVRRRPARANIRTVAYKPRRQNRPLLKLEPPKFVPTTLVIYAENGVINSRIEPWLQAGLITRQ